MNKTVNINLAGIFFHIDEDAYLKLQRYLEAIKRSFTDSQGRAEIIADIEARIAELFSERLINERQVIGNKEVDEVISIMGQPEDYLVDDEIFEDEPQSSSSQKEKSNKKLFRDTDNSYIGGVSAGLAHYFGIDAIWIRLIWILLVVGGFGTGILLYILLWILVPEAKTTAEKLMMTGEPVNISNIEKKIKDGFDSVSETVSGVAKNVSDSVSGAAKKVDIKKQGNKIKSSSRTFFDTLADVIMFFFKIIAKFIGLILILIGASTLIALIVGLFSLGAIDIIPGTDLVGIVNAGETPVWFASLLAFLAVGIPFFFLFYLGLRILITNLKSIGKVAKLSLLGLWLFSLIGIAIVSIREASEHAYNEHYIEKMPLETRAKDTLIVSFAENDYFKNPFYRHDAFKVASNPEGKKTIFSKDLRIQVKSTTDSVASIKIEKSADGRNYEKALDRAKNIEYSYAFNNKDLVLDAYYSTAISNKYCEQEVLITLYLPVESVVYFEKNTESFLNYRTHSNNIVTSNQVNHYLTIGSDNVICKTCETEKEEESFEVNVDMPQVKINDKGIEIKTGDKQILKIDENGINGEVETVRVKIDSTGINITSDEKNENQ
ncbi:PspC domain-containing protein [Aestuariibaculum suncheonense]|uniref:PspC domain-containing protein n=1 Tax=Aestuariibaculum suncheonense TaxID=1028745 RepID=A0A8J6UMH9_9FLAO|nr:PspC domain-containing protein [Aestuariibaculum suncheonense]MBD0836941.1 PspC domain-containing protein [Aestuariibaculum suncheonense]